MQISLCSATDFEIRPLQNLLATFQDDHQFQYFLTGIGMLQSGLAIQQHITLNQPDLLIQVGIAGSFNPDLPLGTVLCIDRDYLGSCGVEQNGKWQDFFDLGLADANQVPFKQKALENPWVQDFTNRSQLKAGAAVTIDEISTDPARIQALRDQYNPVLESMEGAALHLNGLLSNRPFLQIRGISNYIGERDKTKWNIKRAIETVCQSTFELLQQLG